MAFTPEDVLNKHFTATQFRRGYDEQEVDDFLDEIVVELRRLSSDNDDLSIQLKACQESKGVTAAKAAVFSAATAGTSGRAESTVSDDNGYRAPEPVGANIDAEPARIQAALASTAVAERHAQDKIKSAQVSAEQAEKEAAARISKAKADAEQAEAQAAERVKVARAAKDAADKAAKDAADARDAAVKAAKDAADKSAADKSAADKSAADAKDAADKSDKSSVTTSVAAPVPVVAKEQQLKTAAGVLALAEKLHEEYVSEGASTRERLITEGQAHHDKVVGEAAAKQAELLSTGQAKHDQFLAAGQTKHAEFLATGQAKHDSLIAEASARHEQMITEARERSTGMLAEAQQKKAAVIESLARERDLLQKKIDELRIFERDYRARLKSYLESQLKELDHTGVDKAARGEGDDQPTDSRGQQGDAKGGQQNG